MKLKELHEAAGRSVADLKIEYTGGDFDCYKSGVTSLKGCPIEVSGDFDCSTNRLTSLEGAPKEVSGYFYCLFNKLTSLEGIQMHIDSIGDAAHFTNNPIRSHVLGLLLIDKLQRVTLDNKQVQDIVNKYLEGSRDILDCQNELIDVGLKDFAQL